ncbi:hypothetical protein EZJ19_08230 [Parasulfuritortus cantonensis]|uniref:Uncharacterized protein n=1 Tax=Parasulfuritortus cantonensis TaxID=2528202 RepID=A0A4R1BD95_9PROT|nr:hypothetical protein [Parasulfuritortus cantonensis]TCJ15040.1 hypothetical protein EZJ19_08230 [Parasulfuritortus cantonensis]
MLRSVAAATLFVIGMPMVLYGTWLAVAMFTGYSDRATEVFVITFGGLGLAAALVGGLLCLLGWRLWPRKSVPASRPDADGG